MPISVTIVGAQDRSLEDRLRSTGMRIANVAVAELASLAFPLAAPPDIVVLDMREQAQIPPALAQLRRQHPETGLVVVISALEPALMLEAMRAGVTECVTDVARGDLEAAITRLLAQRTAPETGEVFVFVGAKGGVGTTTAAVNVAASFPRIDSAGAVLFVDLHLAGGDAALYLGVESRFSVIDALENIHRLDASYFRGLVAQTKAGLDLLASADRAVAMPVDAPRVRTLLEFAARHYRYSVIDIPRSDAAVLDSLEAASKIIVVANQELATVRGASRTVTMLSQRYGKDKVLVALSRSDRKAEIGLDDLERAVGTRISQIFPSDYRLAVDALNRGKPIVTDGQSALGAAFQAFAHDLAGENAKPASGTRPRAGGLFGRLTGRH